MKLKTQKKLKTKNLDAIILNSLNESGAGFNFETNKITYIDKNYNLKSFKLKTKSFTRYISNN